MAVYAFDVDETLEVSKGRPRQLAWARPWELGDGDAALSWLAPHLLVRGAMRHGEARLFASAAAMRSWSNCVGCARRPLGATRSRPWIAAMLRG